MNSLPDRHQRAFPRAGRIGPSGTGRIGPSGTGRIGPSGTGRIGPSMATEDFREGAAGGTSSAAQGAGAHPDFNTVEEVDISSPLNYITPMISIYDMHIYT